ncbi:MAG: hypothetical protein N2491_01650 [Negativicutes bacterium]|nr:hypothetical protein [Negativicutes bacterium]
MRIELLDEHGARITTIEGVTNPDYEFPFYRYVYKAHAWREIEPEPIPSPPEPTPEEQQAALMKAMTDAVQAHMDTKARAKGYDNLLSAVTYAEEPTVPKFQAEGVAFRAWRSAVWAYCYEQLDAVLSGQRETPTVEQLISELPPLVLPE